MTFQMVTNLFAPFFLTKKNVTVALCSIERSNKKIIICISVADGCFILMKFMTLFSDEIADVSVNAGVTGAIVKRPRKPHNRDNSSDISHKHTVVL